MLWLISSALQTIAAVLEARWSAKAAKAVSGIPAAEAAGIGSWEAAESAEATKWPLLVLQLLLIWQEHVGVIDVQQDSLGRIVTVGSGSLAGQLIAAAIDARIHPL